MTRSGRPSIGRSELSVRVPAELRERICAAASAEGMQMTPWVRRQLTLMVDEAVLLREHARYGMALELIAASRAVDPERLRDMARLALR